MCTLASTFWHIWCQSVLSYEQCQVTTMHLCIWRTVKKKREAHRARGTAKIEKFTWGDARNIPIIELVCREAEKAGYWTLHLPPMCFLSPFYYKIAFVTLDLNGANLSKSLLQHLLGSVRTRVTLVSWSFILNFPLPYLFPTSTPLPPHFHACFPTSILNLLLPWYLDQKINFVRSSLAKDFCCRCVLRL